MIKQKVAKLINIKSIISIIMTIVFCWLAITGVIGAELYVPIYTTVIAFYFGTQIEKRNQENGSTT
jgi:hypothetical protein